MPLPIDGTIAVMVAAPPWGTPPRAIFDALVACNSYEQAHGLPRGCLIDHLCQPFAFDDEATGRPPACL
jgi:hypothetical protein